MPRLDSGGSAGGIHISGVYRALAQREREQNAWYTRLAADMLARDGECSLPDTRLEELLEAGRPVIVQRARVESVLWLRDRPPRPPRLPFDRAVRFVRVSPNDRIGPARDLDPHRDGPVAEGE